MYENEFHEIINSFSYMMMFDLSRHNDNDNWFNKGSLGTEVYLSLYLEISLSLSLSPNNNINNDREIIDF